ncbi:iron-siderophore ABC transporter substrate-binding protein [Microbacterium sp. kSW2-24]|uniref:iron-siderophore ABC transporter substrate-binding protein n=1 Tax=Microbacterium galbinum TaxID=2851646 RepID=UPI001FFCFB39|nr:iron-siderophore ABC transporter substrate-binding protein [Microbacterium galbinum]MCK2022103.1 iron-siderophore ABC transporter substrate-binding protein [Microbacterium galbinum]
MKTTLKISAAVALLALTLAGCSSTPADSGPSSGGSAPTTGTFPQTVETAFGEVTVDSAPQRIVALGWADAETALALGYQPVGASDWLEFGGDGVGPWAEGLYDESPEIIATLEPSYEAIAALDPDLILDVRGSGDQDRYDRLSEIAPTIGVPEGGESYLTTQQQQVEMISTALGMPEKGEELLAEIDDAYRAAADAHPEWAGKTVTAATRTSEGWGAYIEGSNRVQTLERFGFVQNPTIAEIPTNSGGFSVSISSEELDLIDADLIVAFPIYIDTAEITDDAQWKGLPAVADGRSIVIDGDISAAYSLGSPQAALYTVENLTPLLEKALPAS